MVLGDQLSTGIAALSDIDPPHDVVLMAEVMAEYMSVRVAMVTRAEKVLAFMPWSAVMTQKSSSAIAPASSGALIDNVLCGSAAASAGAALLTGTTATAAGTTSSTLDFSSLATFDLRLDHARRRVALVAILRRLRIRARRGLIGVPMKNGAAAASERNETQ